MKIDKLKVLLVEDNEINIDFFKEILKIKGIDCDVAVDREEAVRSCLSKHYDLVFMDCQIPIMDGYEATRRIREAEGDHRHTVIIAITANAVKGDIEKCMEYGMDEYLSKPIELSKITKLIDKYLETKIET
ncbi:MAG: domain S-box [Herbinix sp.]|jgi:CheY-like chemotaxis protein|nr:domain S-box [Herbinix sp.]